MAYVHPQYPPPAPGNRSRASSTASGRYLPPGYNVPHQQASSASMRPEVGTMSPTHSYHPPRPEIYQSNPDYQPPLAIDGYGPPVHRRGASDRPRLSSDSHRASDSDRSRKSYHSRRPRREDPDTGRRSHDKSERHRAVSGDRASVRSKRSHKSHHSLRNHFEDDVGRPMPSRRHEPRHPT